MEDPTRDAPTPDERSDRDEPAPPLPPPPPQQPPASGWNVPPAWTAPPVPQASSFDIARVVGRTFDTLGREWSLFLALAIPAGIGGIVSTVSTETFQALLQDPAVAATSDPLPLLGLQVLIAIMSGITALATVVATDRLWRGQPAGLADALVAAVRLLPRALGLILVALLIAVVFGIVFGLALVVFASVAAVLAVLALVFLAVAVWVGLRLSVVLPVLALEPTPVVAVLGRAWRLTRGRVLQLLVATIAIGIATLVPAWGGSMFSLFVDDRLVAGIAVGLSTLVTAPLSGIWVALAWGELTGAPHADSAQMATGKGRMLAITLIAGVGTVLILAGGALAAAGSEEFLRLYGGA